MKKLILLLLTIVLMVSVAVAGDYDQLAKLAANDPAVSVYFGSSVSMSGNYAIIGAKSEDDDSLGNNTLSNAGAAYIFKRDGASWSQEAKIVPSDRAANDNFGTSVSISGDYAIIGALYEDEDAAGSNTKSNAGSAYIFKRNGTSWTEEAKLVAGDRNIDDLFGYSVSISGDYAIIGASDEDNDASGGNYMNRAGSAYIFKRDGSSWSQEAKIVASDRGSDDYFGISVSISGDYAVVGAYWNAYDASGANALYNAGSAYIFKRDGASWSQETKIVASDREFSDQFGYSVGISGDYAIVGAIWEEDDVDGNNYKSAAGSAYIFKRDGSTWPQEAKIVASDRDTDDYFGVSVGISEDYAIVGAYYEDENASGGDTQSKAGSAYIFNRDGSSWSQEAKLVANDRAANDQFGCSVAISNDIAFVGSNLNDKDASGNSSASNAGAAYVFSLPAEVPLPIELSSFSAKTSKGNIILNWRTESETNNASFILYRNGEALARIDGAGTTSKTNEYVYIDNSVLVGMTYTYVLADVDYSNKETLYENEAITITLNNSIEIENYVLGEAYPNPFNPSTTIEYQLPESCEISVKIFDLSGNEVQTLVSGFHKMGLYKLWFNASNLPGGIYLYRLTAGNEVITKKMLLIK